MDRKSDETGPSDDGPKRPKRADAQKNSAAILRAAKEVFGEAGVDAPTREVARRASVGVGTIYRNFPKRADLISAVFRHITSRCHSVFSCG